LSPRAACLLELYGFAEVYDYVDGKVDWMAYGLPVDGDDGPFVGRSVTDPLTIDVRATVTEARRRLQEAGSDRAVVTFDRGWVVGEVDGETLGGSHDDQPLLEVMHPVPSTVRPSVTVSSLAGSGRRRVVVSTPDGRLLGEALVEADGDDGPDGHDHHDHAGHDHADHDEGSSHLQRMERELTEVMEAVADHFGDSEPSDEELRSFLRDRLVAEGRSPEEADQFMAEIGDQNQD